jgi:hypothetical protein
LCPAGGNTCAVIGTGETGETGYQEIFLENALCCILAILSSFTCLICMVARIAEVSQYLLSRDRSLQQIGKNICLQFLAMAGTFFVNHLSINADLNVKA